MSAEARLAERLAELGLEMPPAPEAKGLYRTLIVVGNLAHTSGHGPVEPGGQWVTGRVGAELDMEAGRAGHLGHGAQSAYGMGVEWHEKPEPGS